VTRYPRFASVSRSRTIMDAPVLVVIKNVDLGPVRGSACYSLREVVLPPKETTGVAGGGATAGGHADPL